MWIASSYGYFSIVEKKNKYYVRARKIEDLIYLLEATGLSNEILQFAGTDYIARIIVTKEELNVIRDTLFDSITYPNFKSKIQQTRTQVDKLKHYNNVWWEMLDYQEKHHPSNYLDDIEHQLSYYEDEDLS